MSNGGYRARWRPSLRTVAPVIVLAAVLAARIGVGLGVDRPPHPITFVGAGAGTLGATVVRYVGRDVYEYTTSPTARFAGRFFAGVPDDRATTAANWLVLVAGALAGGVYPTVFIGVLGLPGTAITTPVPGVLVGVLWGALLATVAILTFLVARALSLRAREDVRVFLEFHLVFTVVFTVVVVLSDLVWYPLFGV